MKKTEEAVNLEKDILRTVQTAVAKSIEAALTTYDSPLVKMSKAVVTAHEEEIMKLMDEALCKTIRSDEFKVACREVFAHRLAKSLMTKMEGSVEKAAEMFRQDPTRRAKIILHIEELLKSFEPKLGASV